MYKKLLLLSVLLLSSCNQNLPSTSITPSVENPTSDLPSISESESIIESESISDSESISESDSVSVEKPSTIIDVTEKEYYKSLVDRNKINYSSNLENDENHNVDNIEIFQLNDTHGAYFDSSDITGISRVASVIKEKTIDPYAVVKIANGDMMQGTAFSNMLLGEPAVASFNEMNFDAFVIGNHEFDWSIDNLSVYKDGIIENGELDCPFLGANIVDGEGNRPNWIEPYTIVNKGNVKVGIIGVIGDNLESSISKVALGNYRFTSTVESVNKYAKILLEDEKVNILIVSSHAQNEFANQSYVNAY